MVERATVDYRDKTPFDQSKLQDLQTIKDAILHKQNGKDVRAPMAQIPDALVKLIEDASDMDNLGALAELVEARGGFETLGLHESAQDSSIAGKASIDSFDILKKQVENISDAPIGTADQSQEIQDARIGWDGHDYVSAGDNIRKKTRNAQDNVYYLQDNIINGGPLKIAPITFVQGGYSHDDGYLSENNTDVALSQRIRSSVALQFPRRVTIYMKDGYSFILDQYQYQDGKYKHIKTMGDTKIMTIDDQGQNFWTIVIKDDNNAPISSDNAYQMLRIESSSLIDEHSKTIAELNSQSEQSNRNDLIINGYHGDTDYSDTHTLELADFELNDNVRDIQNDSHGNYSFDSDNVYMWSAVYTVKDRVDLSCAIKGPGWLLIGSGKTTYQMVPLLNDRKGMFYTLTKGTIEATSTPMFTVNDVWKNSVEGETVFYFEKNGANLKIYIQDNDNKTLILEYDDCNALGIINNSTLHSNLINAEFTERNVTAPGILQRVRSLEKKQSTGGASSDTRLKRFEDYSVLCIGDSITEKNARANVNWVDYLSSWLGFKNVENNGEGGTGIIRPAQPDGSYKNWWSRLDDYTGDYNLILLMGNMNDYSDSAYMDESKLGEFGDDTLDTQYGAVNKYLKKLMGLYPNTQIGWITSTPRQYVNGSKEAAEGYLYGLNSVFEKADQAIIETCHNYSVPVLDLFHESGLAPWLEENRKKYFSSITSPDGDGCHPNDLGHEIIARKIYDFVIRNF